jgi:membrane protease YdiL (CAAX protease family)
MKADRHRSQSANAALYIAVPVGWFIAVASLWQFYVFKHISGALFTTVWQVLAYTLIAGAVLLLDRRIFGQLRASRVLVLMGVALVALGLLYTIAIAHHSLAWSANQLIRQSATGVGEETLFRGLIFTKSLQMGIAPVWAGVLNTILFTVSHVPVTLVSHASRTAFLVDAGVSAAMCYLRLHTKGVLLPACLHAALNLAGV